MATKSTRKRTRTIGQRLRDARTAKQWSTQKLHEESRIAVGTINEAETGKRVPNGTTLLALCKALGITMNELTGA